MLGVRLLCMGSCDFNLAAVAEGCSLVALRGWATSNETETLKRMKKLFLFSLSVG